MSFQSRRLRLMAAELITMADEMEALEGAAHASLPELLTLSEFAKAIRRHVDTARTLCVNGRVPGAFQEREGGHWKIPRAALQAYLEGSATAKSLQLVGRGKRERSPDYLAQLQRGKA
jgi:hypothetical protein